MSGKPFWTVILRIDEEKIKEFVGDNTWEDTISKAETVSKKDVMDYIYDGIVTGNIHQSTYLTFSEPNRVVVAEKYLKHWKEDNRG